MPAIRPTERNMPHSQNGIPEIYYAYSVALAAPERDKINLSMTKTALHRTRLRVLDRKNFSVGFFFKTYRQPAPLLAALRRLETEKIEKNFSIFQFEGSAEDLSKKIKVMKNKEKINFR